MDTVTNKGLCQVCHTSTSFFRRGEAETVHPTTECVTCHTHNAMGGAFIGNGACNACHGDPPAAPRFVSGVNFGTMGNWSSAAFEKYSGGGGAHLVAAHVPKSATKTEEWNSCTMCHNGGEGSHQKLVPLKTHISNITVLLDPKYRFSNGFIVYTSEKLVNSPQKNVTGSCYNTSCHMSPSPKWDAVGGTTCETCHRMPPLDSSPGIREPETGRMKGNHETHGSGSLQACAKCHGDAVNAVKDYGNSHLGKAIRMQGNINSSPQGATYSRGFFNQTSVPPATLGTCSNVNCHFENPAAGVGQLPLCVARRLRPVPWCASRRRESPGHQRTRPEAW